MRANDPYRLMRHAAIGIRDCPMYDTARPMAEILIALGRISGEMTDAADKVDANYVTEVIKRACKHLTYDQKIQLINDFVTFSNILTETGRGLSLVLFELKEK